MSKLPTRLMTPSMMNRKECECSAPLWSCVCTELASPKKGTICPVKMITPIPVTNPVMTACGMASIRIPTREMAIPTRKTPAIRVAASSPS